MAADAGSTSSPDLLVDAELFADFCRHLSSSLNVLDFVYTTRKWSQPGFDPLADDAIVLAVTRPDLLARLLELRYPELVVSCIRGFRLLDSCLDVFRSELDDLAVAQFTAALEQLTRVASFELTEHGILIHCPALIADLILPPLGRLHHEILLSLDHFTQMLDAVEGDPQRLFLNAKSPTPESQYVQIWVAYQLGIPWAPDSGIIGVV